LSKKYSAGKGVEDILPPQSYIFAHLEQKMRDIFSRYGFKEIRIPIIEFTEVFIRGIGETTDIVEKEMYTFTDKAGRSITLRPEGTAPVVRCYVEKHLYTEPSPQRFYYSGPMFRYERPQRGRQRQFYQIGVEAFGSDAPKMDAEVISMLMRFLSEVGVKNYSLELNSIGCQRCRPSYREALRGFFLPMIESLCEDCKRRYEVNPLRILDCKVEGCIRLRKGAPKVIDYLCPECKAHFEELRSLLDALSIQYNLNPEMVRGLDYYSRTTFEVISPELGAQNTFAAGGRYDRLVEEFGGPPTPAIGFAIGVERLIDLIKDGYKTDTPPDAYIATIGKEAEKEALKIADKLRLEGLKIELGYGTSIKSQLRRADRVGSPLVIIIGDDELKKGTLRWKLLLDGSEGEIAPNEVSGFIKLKRNKIYNANDRY